LYDFTEMCWVQVHLYVGVQTCPTPQDIELLAEEFILRGIKIQTVLEAQVAGALLHPLCLAVRLLMSFDIHALHMLCAQPSATQTVLDF
jgi:hypothetical protein